MLWAGKHFALPIDVSQAGLFYPILLPTDVPLTEQREDDEPESIKSGGVNYENENASCSTNRNCAAFVFHFRGNGTGDL